MGRLPTWCCIVCAIFVASGCSSPAMKGTPFYTGEYSKAQGPAEDRVNLWPILYYHDPALSVLWPVFEVTDDHFAVRPIYSVYGLDEPHQVHNFLWPIGEFDFDKRHYRVFPFFWRPDRADEEGYFTWFPFVWLHPDFGGVFPFYLAYWEKGRPDLSVHALWPILHYRDGWGTEGWRVWPFYGRYHDAQGVYSFAGWPIYHEWRDDTTSGVYRLLLPLYYGGSDDESSQHLLIPVFWHSRDKDGEIFLSPLYFSRQSPEESWRLIVPAWYERQEGDERVWVTPLYGKATSPEGTTQILPPLLASYGNRKGERDLWFLAPLTHFRWGGEHPEGHVFPLFYYDDSSFFSIPYGRREKNGSGFWYAAGPLLVHLWSDVGGENERRYWSVAWPLVHVIRTPEERQTGVLPFFWYARFQQNQNETVHVRSIPKGGPTPEVMTRRVRHEERAGWVLPTIWWDFREKLLAQQIDDGDGELEEHRNFGFWPLWSYKRSDERETNELREDFWILGWLYDFKRRIQADEEDKRSEYVRRRILWRMMHYERRDGDTTLDVFPFITYDRRRDTGFKKVSFAWRLFRYEHDGKGGRKLDVLFLPLLR